MNRWKVRKDIMCKKLYGEAEFVDQNYQFIFDQLICFVLAQIKRSKDTPQSNNAHLGTLVIPVKSLN